MTNLPFVLARYDNEIYMYFSISRFLFDECVGSSGFFFTHDSQLTDEFLNYSAHKSFFFRMTNNKKLVKQPKNQLRHSNGGWKKERSCSQGLNGRRKPKEIQLEITHTLTHAFMQRM